MEITDLRASSKKNASRVSAKINKSPLWFESADVELAGIPEVYATAMLFPSLVRKQALSMKEPVSNNWLEGVNQLLPIFNQWWELPVISPVIDAIDPERKTPLNATAVCFTGGVDSFYSLLCSKEKITHIIFAHGFDIPLDDKVRMSAFEKSMREVASELDVKPIVVKTNLRIHPTYSGVDWGKSHGSAIVSIGYLLSDEIGHLIIPASYTYTDNYPWGSSWVIDSKWSTERLNVIHGDATFRRIDKLKYIANEPLVQKHLRVCWENNLPTGNCSACEKCIRTMIGISVWSNLKDYTVFDHSVSLVERVNRLACISEGIEVVYRDFLERDIDNDLKSAISELLKRSPEQRRIKPIQTKPSIVSRVINKVKKSLALP